MAEPNKYRGDVGAQSRERVVLAWALGSLEKEFGRAQDECSPRGKECQQSSTVCAEGTTSAGGLRGGGAKREVWQGRPCSRNGESPDADCLGAIPNSIT